MGRKSASSPAGPAGAATCQPGGSNHERSERLRRPRYTRQPTGSPVRAKQTLNEKALAVRAFVLPCKARFTGDRTPGRRGGSFLAARSAPG